MNTGVSVEAREACRGILTGIAVILCARTVQVFNAIVVNMTRIGNTACAGFFSVSLCVVVSETNDSDRCAKFRPLGT